ncbi:MAG TPA: VWA domain-containing protein [Anaerolineales bacterium]|nr:VWA domain-containing protein [Anaerolineales bacterium]
MPGEGNLLHNLILFGRLLRGLGLDVNPGRMMDVAHALAFVEVGRKPDFYHTLRSLLVHRHEDISLFDQAFNFFWRKPEEGWEVKLPGLEQKFKPKKPPVVTPPLREPKAPEGEPPPSPDEQPQPIVELTLTYSATEVIRRKDFAEMTGEELAAVKQLMATLLWHLGERRTRRRRPGHGQFLDLRRTVRNNLRYGGEILKWAKREPKRKPRPIVIIADISGSMERYTRLLLHFIYGLTMGLAQPVESFVFSTRLTRITRQLGHKDIDHALREVGHTVADWSGGTRIGEALKDFNFDWGRRVLGRGAIVILISDGWDRGDVQLLKKEMARLQRNCHRLIWLNPLLGSPDYEPLTRGMQTALPFIDDFMPVHNLASLEDLAERLATLGERRAERRQLQPASLTTKTQRHEGTPG